MTQQPIPVALPPAPIPASGITPGAPPATAASSLMQLTQSIKVQTPSGQTLSVLGPDEEAFYTAERDKYLGQNSFTHSSDFLDLDRLLFLELLAYRNARWIGTGRDYDGVEVSTRDCERTLKEANDQISKIKNDLGLSKAARDKAAGDSVSAYLTELKSRAKEFGIHRENQLGRALALQNQLFSIVGSYDRSDQVEREKLGFEDEAAIVDWIRTTMRPEYDAVDAYFRKNAQRAWVRKL